MKKKVLLLSAFLTLAIWASLNINPAKKMGDLTLDNIEALASGEAFKAPYNITTGVCHKLNTQSCPGM